MLLVVLALCAPAHAAEPVEQDLAGGVVNWTDRTVYVNGVGAPKLLSATGAITERDPYEMARDDARGRLARVLLAIPLDATRKVRDVLALKARSEVALKAFTTSEARHFSDGTVHLPARLGFEWIPDAMPVGARAVSRADDENRTVTGLIILVAGDPSPAIQLTLTDAEQKNVIAVGLPSDSAGRRGVVWVRDQVTAEAHPFAGQRPIVLRAEGGSKPGQLNLDPSATAEIDQILGQDRSIPGGVVVVALP